jgi:hypothetical protein
MWRRTAQPQSCAVSRIMCWVYVDWLQALQECTGPRTEDTGNSDLWRWLWSELSQGTVEFWVHCWGRQQNPWPSVKRPHRVTVNVTANRDWEYRSRTDSNQPKTPVTDGGKDKVCALVTFFLWFSPLARGMATPTIPSGIPEMLTVMYYSGIKFCIILPFNYVSLDIMQCKCEVYGISAHAAKLAFIGS